MSPKELLYIEDTLGHAQFMQQLAAKNAEIFSRFYRLV